MSPKKNEKKEKKEQKGYPAEEPEHDPSAGSSNDHEMQNLRKALECLSIDEMNEKKKEIDKERKEKNAHYLKMTRLVQTKITAIENETMNAEKKKEQEELKQKEEAEKSEDITLRLTMHGITIVLVVPRNMTVGKVRELFVLQYNLRMTKKKDHITTKIDKKLPMLCGNLTLSARPRRSLWAWSLRHEADIDVSLPQAVPQQPQAPQPVPSNENIIEEQEESEEEDVEEDDAVEPADE